MSYVEISSDEYLSMVLHHGNPISVTQDHEFGIFEMWSDDRSVDYRLGMQAMDYYEVFCHADNFYILFNEIFMRLNGKPIWKSPNVIRAWK